MANLRGLVERFEREVDALQRQFNSFLAQHSVGYWDGPRGGMQVSVIVRLHDAWGRYCRELVLLSARGNVASVRGQIVPRSPVLQKGQRPIDGLRAVMKVPAKKHIWEPRWFDLRSATSAANQLQIANLPTVVAGLGITQSSPTLAAASPDGLRDCRNYFAHRSELADNDLAALRSRLGLSPRARADDIPRVVLPGGATLFAGWCADLLMRAGSAAQ